MPANLGTTKFFDVLVVPEAYIVVRPVTETAHLQSLSGAEDVGLLPVRQVLSHFVCLEKVRTDHSLALVFVVHKDLGRAEIDDANLDKLPHAAINGVQKVVGLVIAVNLKNFTVIVDQCVFDQNLQSCTH